jgi:hypothetical protein
MSVDDGERSLGTLRVSVSVGRSRVDLEVSITE